MKYRITLFSLATVFLLGCGGEEKRPEYPVTGTIMYDGKPLANGSIVLDPADGMGGSSAGGIVDGKVEMQAQAGKKIVRISANRETGEKDEYGEIITESYIPDKYNLNSTLQFEVIPDKENKFDFNLDK